MVIRSVTKGNVIIAPSRSGSSGPLDNTYVGYWRIQIFNDNDFSYDAIVRKDSCRRRLIVVC